MATGQALQGARAGGREDGRLGAAAVQVVSECGEDGVRGARGHDGALRPVAGLAVMGCPPIHWRHVPGIGIGIGVGAVVGRVMLMGRHGIYRDKQTHRLVESQVFKKRERLRDQTLQTNQSMAFQRACQID